MESSRAVYLLTGSNIEPRNDNLLNASIEIEAFIGDILKRSLVYESEAWGFGSKNAFLNQVLVVRTKLSAESILNRILQIEKKLGRIRTKKGYTSRTIDIDVLYYENAIINKEELIVPHPRLHIRKFTLLPLVEIAENFKHPVLNKTNRELLEELTDEGKVWIYKEGDAL